MVQVLQQERVEAESLDEVDSLGKTLLDRLTMPVIFPDGYVHIHLTYLNYDFLLNHANTYLAI